jgi:hypothetical protein
MEYNILLNNTVDDIVFIQSYWRSYRCRQRVSTFKQLPDDLWQLILTHMRSKPPEYHMLDRLLRRRFVTLYWTPPRAKLKFKLQTLQLLRKYMHILDPRTVHKGVLLAIRIVKHDSTTSNASLMFNAVLEHFQNMIK